MSYNFDRPVSDHEHCAGGKCWQNAYVCPAGGAPASSDPTPEEMGESMGQIADTMGGEGVALITTLMERSAREIAWAEEQGRKGLEAERDEWRERALAAEAHIDAITLRFNRLLAPPPTWDE